ncbi:MAG: hypothetical protein HC923_02545 [Myxococcales bacterium]|nr:hypothetical protein [Myxococcales bacterium]
MIIPSRRLLLVGVLCGCGESSGDLVITPTEVSLGCSFIGCRETVRLTVSNETRTTVTVLGVAWSGPALGTLHREPLALKSAESGILELELHSSDLSTATASEVVVSLAAGPFRVERRISVLATPEPDSRLEASPDPVLIGPDGSGTLTLRRYGRLDSG